MAEHEHNHDHGHGHDHGEAPSPASFPEMAQDAASASLSRALRMSFRLLTGVMIFVIGLFAFTGMTTIKAGEEGVVTVFGRQVDVVGPGLHYTWPFPIGQIRTISVAKRVLAIDDFWMNLSPDDMAKKDLSKVNPPSQGLRPGLDGALLTGDAYLFHTKIECTYEVENASAFLGGVVEPNGVIEAAVCRAAIRAAAHGTAEGLVLGEEQGRFKTQIQDEAQDFVSRMNVGVRITQIKLSEITWPLRALPDFAAAQNAAQKQSTTINDAIKEAKNILNAVAGPNYRSLVGEPWTEDAPAGASQPGDANLDLIGQYELARQDSNGSEPAREALLGRIDDILLSQSTQGEVATLLSAASHYKDAQKNAVEARAQNLQTLLADYKKAPDFFLQRMWTEAREEILQSPTVVKWFVNSDQGKTIILINTPPEILKYMGDWWLHGLKAP